MQEWGLSSESNSNMSAWAAAPGASSLPVSSAEPLRRDGAELSRRDGAEISRRDGAELSRRVGAEDALTAGRRALEIEAEGLRRLAEALDGSFRIAVETLATVRGRVVVTGMGKSGHVARKIASTLASTGTPAIFVHPAEASHGDLGMITPGDAVLALSNSGETAELGAIVERCRRFRIPLVAVVGRKPSALADNADVAVTLPEAPEACPMGLAPTTSTTMMLALGDALAVALLARIDFSPAHFQALHPGGNLGKRLVTVADIMHGGEHLPLIARDAGMDQALLTMTAKSFGCVGVVDSDGHLIGIVTDGDLRRHMDHDLLNQKVEAVMTAGPRVIRPNALAAEALGEMNRSAITSLFVVEDRRPIGILHLHDCLRAGVA